jgi:MSHA biogenesis protein MshP
MSPNRKFKNQKFHHNSGYYRPRRGSSLVIAIFVIVVMSLLGAALVKMMDSSQENLAFEVLGTRAYNAAQTGVQWQLAQLFPVGLNSITVNTCADVRSDNSIVLPDTSNISGLQGCRIVDPIQCEDFLASDGVRYYTITSVGQCDINGEVTSRVIEVEARSMQ